MKPFFKNARLIGEGGLNVKAQRLLFVLILLVLFMIMGCSYNGNTTKVTIDSIDAKEVLNLDSNADIFQFGGVIYKTNIDWVEKLSLKKIFK